MSYLASIPVVSTFPVTDAKDYHTFVESFTDEGIQNPIIVLKRTKEQWEKDKEKYPFIFNFPVGINPKTSIYQIRCGHNRFRYAVENDYVTISAMVCETEAEVSELCKENQRWWKNH